MGTCPGMKLVLLGRKSTNNKLMVAKSSNAYSIMKWSVVLQISVHYRTKMSHIVLGYLHLFKFQLNKILFQHQCAGLPALTNMEDYMLRLDTLSK